MSLLIKSVFIVLAGKTGSGKTSLINQLELSGYPSINLEKIASHRGSAFGGMILAPQPSQKDFEHELEHLLLSYTDTPYIFIEQKGSSLGKRKIPSWLYSKINEGIFVQLNVDKKTRIQNILREYSPLYKQSFTDALTKLEKRLSITVMKQSAAYLEEENYGAFIEKMLDYYDKSSKYNISKKPSIIIPVQTEDPFYTTQQLLQALKQADIIIS
jgi:tRNA 2-selenouridine synthase